MFLPKYSPELNPVEHIFGMIKTYIRNNSRNRNFRAELISAFASITYGNVAASYRHCLRQ